jgi:hypothetical protein
MPRVASQAVVNGRIPGQLLIFEVGGLPVRLEGMTMTCHAFAASPAYRRLHDALEAHIRGQSDPATILPGPCDAAEITP